MPGERSQNQRLPGSGWLPALCLGLSVFCLLGLFGRGELSSIDEQYVYHTAIALMERGSLVIQWPESSPPPRTTSRFSPLPSVWAAPFYAVGKRLTPADSASRSQWLMFFTCLSSSFAVALTCVVLFCWIRSLEGDAARALGWSLVFVFGTPAWPYSATCYIQVLTTLLLLVFCWSAANNRPFAALISAAFLVFCRSNMIVPTTVTALLVWFSSSTSSRRTAVSMLVGSTIGMAGALLVNQLRGDALVSGAYSGEAFVTPVVTGLYGLLFSSGKGLLWMSPIALFGLFVLVGAARRGRPELLLMLLVGTHLIMMATWWTWHGGRSWGPRLLLPILPLGILAVARQAGLHSSGEDDGRQRGAGFLLMCVAWISILINSYAACVSTNDYFDYTSAAPLSEMETIFVPGGGPLLCGVPPSAPWLLEQTLAGDRLARTLLTVFVAGAVLGLGATIRFARTGAPFGRLWASLAVAVIAVLALFPHWPDWWGGQYRQLEPVGDKEYRGRLVAPVTGVYTFFTDQRRPVFVELDRRQLFTQSPYVTIELQQGPHNVRIVGRSAPLGPLSWTIPGGSRYKQRIESVFLTATTPTLWQRSRLLWRDHQWAVLVLLLVLFVVRRSQSHASEIAL